MSLSVGFVLAVLAVAAFAGPLLGEVLGVPGAVVEIVAGLALSTVIPAADWRTGSPVATLGSLGFYLLMFLVGAELSFGDIWREARSALLVGVALIALTLLVSALVMGRVAGASRLWVLSGAAVSIGIAAPVLHALGRDGSRTSRDVLVVGTVAETTYLVVLTALAVASHRSLSVATDLLVARAAALVIFAIVLVRVLRRVRQRTPHHFHRWFRRDDPVEVGLRGTFALLFVVIAFANLVHIPTVLGALLAGLLFRQVFGRARGIVERVSGVANAFFIPLFFLTVGLSTQVGRGVVSLLPTIGLLLVVLAVPRLTLIAYLRWRGHSGRDALGGALLLMAPLTVLITTAEIGSQAGLVGPRNAAAMVLAATISAVIYPALARRLLRLPEADAPGPELPSR